MIEEKQLSNTLENIKQMMERSSRFISLSGLSGISAGICALTGAWFAKSVIEKNNYSISDLRSIKRGDMYSVKTDIVDYLQNPLFQIAIITFIAAFVSAFAFTYLRSKKNNIPIWGTTARRLMLNVIMPMIAGGIFLLKLIDAGVYGFIAPGCLIFYGLAVLNASKYTLLETKYLGYSIMLTGLVNLWFMGYGLYFWAIGFGVFHIIYGAAMWWKYEKSH